MAVHLPSYAARAEESGPPIPPGWYLACFSKDLRGKRPIPLVVGGEEVVAFRTQSGRAAVLARHCAHMGASLAGGKVVGETIQCPFHHFRFDASGRCIEIPNCPKIPPNARMQTYPLVERLNGVWIYVGGARPAYELPSDDELFPGGGYFCAGAEDLGEIATTGQDILENAVDLSHADSIHQVHVERYELTRVEPFRFEIDADIAVMGKRFRSHTLTTVHGPGLWIAQLHGGFYKLPVTWALVPTPVGPRATRLRALTWVKGNRHLPWVNALARLYTLATRSGAMQDVTIWNNKIVQDRPVLTAADGPVMKYRRWWGELAGHARAADEVSTNGHRAAAD